MGGVRSVWVWGCGGVRCGEGVYVYINTHSHHIHVHTSLTILVYTISTGIFSSTSEWTKIVTIPSVQHPLS